MKKLFFTAILIIPFVIHAQNKSFVQQKDWDSIIARLAREDWGNADKLIDATLKNCPKDSLETQSACILRYMYIMSQAGLMSNLKLSNEKALANVKSFEGRRITIPGVLISKEPGYNVLNMKGGNADTLQVVSSGKIPGSLLSSTFIVLAKKLSKNDFSMLAGLDAIITGTIRSIDVANVYMAWFKILIDKAEMQTVF